MSWYNHNGIPARALLKLDDVEDNGALLFLSDPDARFPTGVYELDQGYMDHAVNIPWRWTTPHLNLGAPGLIKRFTHLVLDFEDYNGGIEVHWDVDDGRRTGSLLAKIETENRWGNDTDQIKKLWNDEDGETPNGLYWWEWRRKPLVYLLPSSCRGKEIQLTFECPASGNAPPILNEFGFHWEAMQQTFPQKARNPA